MANKPIAADFQTKTRNQQPVLRKINRNFVLRSRTFGTYKAMKGLESPLNIRLSSYNIHLQPLQGISLDGVFEIKLFKAI